MDGIRIASVKANELLRCDTRKHTAGEHVLTVLVRGKDSVQTIARGDDAVEELVPFDEPCVVGALNRRAELSHAANQRYLEALKTVSVSTPLSDLTDPLSQPLKDTRGRRHRALNLLSPDDARRSYTELD